MTQMRALGAAFVTFGLLCAGFVVLQHVNPHYEVLDASSSSARAVLTSASSSTSSSTGASASSGAKASGIQGACTDDSTWNNNKCAIVKQKISKNPLAKVAYCRDGSWEIFYCKKTCDTCNAKRPVCPDHAASKQPNAKGDCSCPANTPLCSKGGVTYKDASLEGHLSGCVGFGTPYFSSACTTCKCENDAGKEASTTDQILKKLGDGESKKEIVKELKEEEEEEDGEKSKAKAIEKEVKKDKEEDKKKDDEQEEDEVEEKERERKNLEQEKNRGPKETEAPTAMPSRVPTLTPSLRPTIGPTLTPTRLPGSSESSSAQSLSPTLDPTLVPSLNPTIPPTKTPTFSHLIIENTLTNAGVVTPPSSTPTLLPSAGPSVAPSIAPTFAPTWAKVDVKAGIKAASLPGVPGVSAVAMEEAIAKFLLTAPPTFLPTGVPSVQPSAIPTLPPTPMPSMAPITGCYQLRPKGFIHQAWSQHGDVIHDSHALFKIVPGLAGHGTVSIESCNKPGHFYGHAEMKMILGAHDGTRLFREAASFYERKSLFYMGFLSFEAFDWPDHYVTFEAQALTLRKRVLTVAFKEAASWEVT